MNVSQRIVGVLLQCVAVVILAPSVFGLGAAVFAILRSTSGDTVNLHLDLAGYVLPFALWFLGSELKRNSDSARRVTVAAMVYLSVVGVIALTFLLFSGLPAHWPSVWKLKAYGMTALLIFVPILCIYGLRKRNIG